jgi:hypothetical protein
MSEAEHLTVSIHLRVSPLEAELIDLRLVPRCKTRPELLRYLLQDVEFLGRGRRFPQAGPWRERADAVIAKYDLPDQGDKPGVTFIGDECPWCD